MDVGGRGPGPSPGAAPGLRHAHRPPRARASSAARHEARMSSDAAGQAAQPEGRRTPERQPRPAPARRRAQPAARTLLLLYADPRMRRQLFAGLRPWLDERGLRLVLADDELGEPDRALFHELLPMPPPRFLAQAVDRLCDHALRQPFDAILAESELALLPGALASARLE